MLLFDGGDGGGGGGDGDDDSGGGVAIVVYLCGNYRSVQWSVRVVSACAFTLIPLTNSAERKHS